MLNLNLMHYNDEESLYKDPLTSDHQQSIKQQDHYELNSNSDSSQMEQQSQHHQQFQIDHSLEDLSVENDTFLQHLQMEKPPQKNHKENPRSFLQKDAVSYLSVSRRNVEMTLIKTQSAEESISFTNITAFPIKMKFSQCPFQIHSEKSLAFVHAKQLEIILQPFSEASITFLIKPLSADFGDIIETVVIISDFIGRDDFIAPTEIHFNVHYVMPSIKLKFQGKSDSISIARNRVSVARLKANKIGEYCLQVGLGEESPRMNVGVETRGKVTCSTSSLQLSDSLCSIKLRKKGVVHPQGEKYLLLLKATEAKLSFMIGIQFI